MPIKIAFVGFRHAHIFDLYNRAKEWPEYEVVAACEEDSATRKALAENGNAEITHDDYRKMLDEVPCDVVAVGDYYGKRGSIILEALKRGKHAIADKPICTSLSELHRIASVSARKNLSVGCMLDMRDKGLFIKVKELIREGAIGEVNAITIGGQHPLLLGTRPGWYFEPGRHGGTINDIGIHAFDLIPWVTGGQFVEVTAARSWNAVPKDTPHFMDAGQFMLRMDNGCGVMGEVSYFMPDTMGYTLDLYWRITFFGTGGMIETSINSQAVMLARNGASEPEMIPPAEGAPGGYLRSFTEEITTGRTDGLSTADVLRAAEIALTTQSAGDTGRCHVHV